MKFLNRGSMKGEKGIDQEPQGLGFWIRFVTRILQFVFALTVIGLYAVDLDNARKAHKYIDSKWAFAVAVGSISSLFSLCFLLPFVKAWFFFFIDAFIWFLWLVLFGIFGKMYIPENAEGNKGIIRMKHAVWIDLVNLLMWTGTALYGAFIFWKARKARPSVV